MRFHSKLDATVTIILATIVAFALIVVPVYLLLVGATIFGMQAEWDTVVYASLGFIGLLMSTMIITAVIVATKRAVE